MKRCTINGIIAGVVALLTTIVLNVIDEMIGRTNVDSYTYGIVFWVILIFWFLYYQASDKE